MRTWTEVLKEKGLPPEGEFTTFLFQEGDGFAFCPLCAEAQGDEVQPLSYPAIKICVKRPTAKQVEVGGSPALHWHWEYTNFCIAHALEVLLTMQASDIMPKPENIEKEKDDS